MEINTKEASLMNTKSSGFSPYVASQLLGGSLGGIHLSSTVAYWLWEKCDTVADACDRIATPFTMINPVLKDKKTGEYLIKSSDHPFLELLASPGFKMDSVQLMYTLMTSYLVTGNCFPVLTGNINYEPNSIHTFSGNKANLVQRRNEELGQIQFSDTADNNIYYRQEIPKRKTAVFQALNNLSETMQILVSQKRNGVEAQSPLERIYHQAMTKYYGNIHNSGLLKNASRPGGLWSPADGPLSPNQYEEFKHEIDSKFTGPSTAGKNIVAPAPVKYENFLLNPRDMDFIQLIKTNRTEIYNTYQIPLALVSEDSMTLSNFENSMIALYDLALLPRAKILLKRLGDFVLPRYKDGDRFELTYNEKDLTALKARMFARAKAMREIASFSEDEIRSETGYESLGEGGDAVWKPANSIESGLDDDYNSDGINIDEDD